MSPETLIALSAFIVMALGVGHLALTYFTTAFSPRDAALEEQLKSASPILTSKTTLWRGQIGFHASHGLGAMVFGAVYAYLALTEGAMLLHSPFLLTLGAIVLSCYVLLAKLYWFALPLAGLSVALGFYIAAVVAAAASG